MKRLLLGLGAVVVGLTMAFSPSISASAATQPQRATLSSLTFGEVFWDVNSAWHLCIDDSSNLTTSGNPLILEGEGNNSCGGPASEWNTPLDGTQWAIIPNDWGFALELKNQSNGAMCMDDRGSITNGTQYVIKPCNSGSGAQGFLMCQDDTTGTPEMVQVANGDFVWLSGNNSSNGTPIVVHSGYAGGRQEAYWVPSPSPANSLWVGNC